MTLDYQKVWNALNELEMVTSKVCSAREILDSAIDALENHKKDKAEALMYATNEYLAYYLDDFDKKFKIAWNETVVKVHREENISNNWESFYYPKEHYNSTQYTDEELNAMCNYAEKQGNDNIPPSGHSDMEALSQKKEDKVVKWILPVEADGVSGEYFITFPDDLLERAGWEEGDTLNWLNNGDGTFTLTKQTEPLGTDEC